MAHILLLTPQLPYPPHQGTSLRNWHILRGLAERHTVSLLSFAETNPAHLPALLTELCARVETVPAPQRTTAQRLSHLLRRGSPDMAQRLASDALATALQRHLATEPPDIVQVEGLEMAHTIPTIRAHSRAVVVLDCHNAETELQRRAYQTDTRQPRRWAAAAYSRIQIGRLAEYERWAMIAADGVVAVSEADAAQLATLRTEGEGPIRVVPNSIDVNEYVLGQTIARAEQQFDLVFSGKMDYRPNVDAVLWFADAVWPGLRQARPNITWAIVGQRPHAQLDRLRTVPGITITGRVEQVQPYLAGANVIIMPLRIGSGTRLKLIEGMAGGKAIVSTPLGAEGFPVRDGEQLVLAVTPDEWSAEIQRLLDDATLRRTLGQAARDFAQAYDWRVVVPRFDTIYDDLLRRDDPPRQAA
jgi:glycosyltransferase involved in cell wall biosynthesis